MQAPSPSKERYVAAGFFALRTPLLPFSDYLGWAKDLTASAALGRGVEFDAALAADRKLLRQRLREIVARVEVREALCVASPTLDRSIEHWLSDPDSERGSAAERVLVRYFQRMTHRCTPFGLFAGHAVGSFGNRVQLQMPARSRSWRRTRLDRGLVSKLVSHLERSLALRASLRYSPNNSLYRTAGRLRYTQFDVDAQGNRQYRLVAVSETAYLLEAIERSRAGATPGELATAIAEFADVAADEAAEFVHELIDAQILVPDLELPITGPDAIDGLIERLERCPQTLECASTLRSVARQMMAMDEAGLVHPPARYAQLSEDIARLPVQVEHSSWQVDLFKPGGDISLNEGVRLRVQECAALVQRLTPLAPLDPLASFRREFKKRFGERRVPLMEALDPETGIAFPADSGAAADDLALLEGFVTTPAADASESTWTRRDVFMLRRLERLSMEGRSEWELTDADLKELDAGVAADSLPESCDMAVRICAPSAQAVERGDFDLLYQGCFGPPAGRMVGRFCYGDEQLEARTREHLRAEEQRAPDVVFAELVHLPQGRSGNLLVRPVLRDHELVYLGTSGADSSRQILVADLSVAVIDDRVVLYSERLGRQVVPRLTSALSYKGTLGLSQFLGAIVEQHARNWLGWSWGQLHEERFLPRVRHGRVVLARATWRVDAAEIAPIVRAASGERFRLAQQWRRDRNLPQLCLLIDGENELLLDLDNPLSLDTFCDVVKNRSHVRIEECMPGAAELPFSGPEGPYTHELVVPLLRERVASRQQVSIPRPVEKAMSSATRPAENLAPGSEWLYFKLYGAERSADSVLLEAIAPVVDELRAQRAIDGWFFIRYSDPDPHLRVRFHGQPAAMIGPAMAGMHAAVAPLLDDGRVWRMELATYERETERYGGPENIERAERLFALDSDCVVEILKACGGEEGASHRWQLALAGADRWLEDLGLDLEARRSFARSCRDAFVAEFNARNKATQGWFAERFRKERKSLESLLTGAQEELPAPIAAGLDALALRSRRSAPLIAEIHQLRRAQRLGVPLEELANSIIHMFINRAMRSSQRVHELVIYEFLARLYDSRCARLESA